MRSAAFSGPLMASMLVLSAGWSGCDRGGGSSFVTDGSEENLSQGKPTLTPQLPSVPKLPPPPHPIQYKDDSYSLYGLRQQLGTLINEEVAVTGYVISVYEPPNCDKKKDPTCEELVPHVWIADEADEKEQREQIALVGYARNRRDLGSGAGAQVRSELKPGAKVQVTGLLTYIASNGFTQSRGVLEYKAHKLLDGPSGGTTPTAAR